jgi:hypothetical protein
MGLVLPSNIVGISRLRFDALAGYSRQPSTEIFAHEIAWYEHQTAPVLGVLFMDVTDEDYGGAIMGRDEGGRFRCVDVVGFDESPAAAEKRLIAALEGWAKRPASDTAQGGKQYPFVDVFAPVVPGNCMSTAFARLMDAEGFSPARGLIEAMMPYFEDVDGNFVEQFQSSGFDARFWELYLFAVLTEGRYVFNRRYQAPDYLCRGISQEIFVEAVTVNPTRQASIVTEPEVPKSREDIVNYLRHYMPMKWGSALVSKLRKEYWTLPHVKEKPIVFAIQDFHTPRAMTFAHSSLIPYLYGVDFAAFYDADERLHLNTMPVKEHIWGAKRIESGFFNLPGAEMISAVIQNPTATISKFNRMGRLAGFGSEDVRMLRFGVAYDPDPNAAMPVAYVRDVNSSDYAESWAEGLNVFHNPNARYPLDEIFFPHCMNHRFTGDQIVHNIPEFHPFTAETLILSPSRVGKKVL